MLDLTRNLVWIPARCQPIARPIEQLIYWPNDWGYKMHQVSPSLGPMCLTIILCKYYDIVLKGYTSIKCNPDFNLNIIEVFGMKRQAF
jgi:hypothetical protein